MKKGLIKVVITAVFSQNTYNYLNLPELVTLNDGSTLDFVYDAVGTKLRKIYTPNEGTATATDYVSGIYSTDSVWEFAQFSEGRILNATGVPEYQYNITDHQSNVRAIWNTDGTLDQISDYYPFGLLHTDPNLTGAAPVNQYLHQGQEYQVELGWNQFKWRNADPAIGRFFNVDPLSEKYLYNSTYAYSENRAVNAVELEGLEAVLSRELMENMTNRTVL